MKKSKIIAIIIVVILLIIVVGVVGYNLYLVDDATKKAEEIYLKAKTYTESPESMLTGAYFDFSSFENQLTKAKVTEGVIFIDEDHSISTYSNLKINDMYCTNNGEVKCGKKIKKDDNVVVPPTHKEYFIGDAIQLADGSGWHVVHRSTNDSKYVMLMKDTRIDYNGDGFLVDIGGTADPDRVPFDTSGSRQFDVTKPSNIGYYLNNTYKNSLSSYVNVLEVRIPTVNELILIEQAVGFTGLTEEQRINYQNSSFEVHDLIGLYYDDTVPYFEPIEITEDLHAKLFPHWLYNAYSGNYWLINGKNSIRTAVWDGSGVTTYKPTTAGSIKPIIVVEKSSLSN